MAKLVASADGTFQPAEDEVIVDLTAADDEEEVRRIAQAQAAAGNKQPVSNDEPAEPAPEADIPEKFAGKSQADLVRMLQEAEKFAGRQSQEVGELRRSVDKLIEAQLTATPAAPAPSGAPVEEEIDFFENPEEAVRRQLANDPRLNEVTNVARQLKQQSNLAQIERLHPDMQSIVADQAFAEWATATPTRAKLLRSADQEYDVEAADELFSLWKERKGIAAQAVENDKTERKQSVKAASTGDTRSTGAAPTKRIYRRADVRNLMQNDPERYASMAAELRQAYAEGRVR